MWSAKTDKRYNKNFRLSSLSWQKEVYFILNIKNNKLYIGNILAKKIAEKFGTPLYVYDVNKIKSSIKNIKSSFKKESVPFQIEYASKAFSIMAIYQLLKEEGVRCDAVSGGEIETAKKASFPMKDISFNGNNKSKEELKMALSFGVGTIIIDNFYEIGLLKSLLKCKKYRQKVLIRINPGITAHTHKFIVTGNQDSKFGFDLFSGQAKKAFQEIINFPQMELVGLHAHIGSQIFDSQTYKKLTSLLFKTAYNWNFTPKIIDVGGGFGIKYTKGDDPDDLSTFIKAICDEAKSDSNKYNINLPEIWVEPGRSIVGPAGYTLYTIGSKKEAPKIRNYVAVDGGMGDNIRPALYGAKYEGVLVNQVVPNETSKQFTLVGKYCESGDVIIPKIKLDNPKSGDIIAILDTGAYGFSMASNYNRNPRPAVVFVDRSKLQLVVKRETYNDITHLDLKYEV